MPVINRSEEAVAASDGFAALGGLAALALGAVMAVQTADPVMRFHAILFLVAAALATGTIVLHAFGPDWAAPASVSLVL